MVINIVCVGTLKEEYFKKIMSTTLKKLNINHQVKVIELSEERCNEDSQKLIERTKIKEGERIIASIGNNSYVILLDLDGKKITSSKFKQMIENKKDKDIYFIIGGSYGVSDDVRKISNERFDYFNIDNSNSIINKYRYFKNRFLPILSFFTNTNFILKSL